MNYIGHALDQLYLAFGEINKKYYSNRLQKPVITIQTKGTTKSSGWTTREKVWTKDDIIDFEKEPGFENN